MKTNTAQKRGVRQAALNTAVAPTATSIAC
jgi:hypothetical protein